jgi:hypothetical protein
MRSALSPIRVMLLIGIRPICLSHSSYCSDFTSLAVGASVRSSVISLAEAVSISRVAVTFFVETTFGVVFYFGAMVGL